MYIVYIVSLPYARNYSIFFVRIRTRPTMADSGFTPTRLYFFIFDYLRTCVLPAFLLYMYCKPKIILASCHISYCIAGQLHAGLAGLDL